MKFSSWIGPVSHLPGGTTTAPPPALAAAWIAARMAAVLDFCPPSTPPKSWMLNFRSGIAGGLKSGKGNGGFAGVFSEEAVAGDGGGASAAQPVRPARMNSGTSAPIDMPMPRRQLLVRMCYYSAGAEPGAEFGRSDFETLLGQLWQASVPTGRLSGDGGVLLELSYRSRNVSGKQELGWDGNDRWRIMTPRPRLTPDRRRCIRRGRKSTMRTLSLHCVFILATVGSACLCPGAGKRDSAGE